MHATMNCHNDELDGTLSHVSGIITGVETDPENLVSARAGGQPFCAGGLNHPNSLTNIAIACIS